QAEQLGRRVLQREPRNPAAAYAGGGALREQGHLEQAAHFLERAARGAPTVGGYWGEVGAICGRVGRLNEGQEAILRAIDADPAHEFARLHRADSLMMMGLPEEAARAALETVKAAPDNFLHRATAATFTCYSSEHSPNGRMEAHRDVAAAVERVPK